MNTAISHWKGYRYFLPSSASTGWAAIAFLLGFTGAFFNGNTEFLHIEESFFAAKPIFWVMNGLILFGLVIVRLLLALYKPFALLPNGENKKISIFIQIGLLLAIFIFTTGLTSHLNRILDAAKPRLVKMTVIDKFRIDLGVKGYYSKPISLYLIGFDVPKELKDWALVLVDQKWKEVSVDENRWEESSIFEKFYPGQSFSIKSYPGKFGLPWFDFQNQPQLTRYVHCKLLGTNLRKMTFGKTTMANEALRYRNVIKAQGILSENSPSKRILEGWKVPVEPSGSKEVMKMPPNIPSK